jgi:hypothetical protein
MSRFELPKGTRDPYSILNEYRPKLGQKHTEAERAYDDFANPIDEVSFGIPEEGENIEYPGSNSSHPVPAPLNSPILNLRGHNDETSHSRLDQIAEALLTLTYGEMLELAESMWKANSQGSAITESNLPKVLYLWSTSRSIENLR